jgi:hypothetical protein
MPSAPANTDPTQLLIRICVKNGVQVSLITLQFVDCAQPSEQFGIG